VRPMAGLQGTLVRQKGKFQAVISIELIQRSIVAELPEPDLDPLP
jgi:hypothetical protein